MLRTQQMKRWTFLFGFCSPDLGVPSMEPYDETVNMGQVHRGGGGGEIGQIG